jgi:phosphate transport system permease protein
MSRSMPKKRIEHIGMSITGLCVSIVVILVAALIAMVAQHGIATFTTDGVDLWSFLSGTVWNPHATDDSGNSYFGALPMIVGSFAVTLLSCLFVLPFAIGAAIFVVEIAPGFGRKVFRPAIELLVGIPSVVFGLLGLTIVVPWVRSWAGGTGYGIFACSLVLTVMILPTVTSLAIDAIEAVPESYRSGSYGLGCTHWQTIWHIVLKSASPGIMTAIVLGMARAFGEALAVEMIIGNAATIPDSLFTPAATLTSILTTSMGNEVTGTVYSDALWSLALILMLMSLVFISVIHFIGRRGLVARG